MTPANGLEAESSTLGSVVNYLPTILWQRRYYILVPFLALLVIGSVAAYLLPTMYRSSATLLVQSQELPENIVESPVAGAVDQRIARIRQQVLSRGDLIAIIEQHDLYPEERRSQPMSKVVEKMRHATVVSALSGDIGQQTGSQNNTIALNMSFDYRDPAKAQAVLQNHVSRFLSMDTQNVEDQAGLTVRFLQDQANRLQSQISQIEGQLTALKARNGAALASSGVPPLIDTGSSGGEITALQNQNRQLIAQSRRPPERDSALISAEAALAAAESQYNDSHPDVIQARERLAQLRKILPPSADNNAEIQEQIAANNAAIQALMAQRAGTLARVNSAMAGQARAPAIMEQAMQLENRASTLRAQYQQISENLLKAQNGARMATERRAEHLALVEPASLPDRPYSPNRPVLIGAAAAGGLLLGFLLALILEFVFKPIRSPRQLEQMHLPILGVVPLIKSNSSVRRRRLLPWGEKRLAA